MHRGRYYPRFLPFGYTLDPGAQSWAPLKARFTFNVVYATTALNVFPSDWCDCVLQAGTLNLEYSGVLDLTPLAIFSVYCRQRPRLTTPGMDYDWKLDDGAGGFIQGTLSDVTGASIWFYSGFTCGPNWTTITPPFFVGTGGGVFVETKAYF